ncbi:MAG: prolipoprotein diacylglyceryl transferase [Gemmatimonadota bacterium]|nr:prolipoprotein diacylglyceryl transferase [Gemmatimonadota bacterium]
MTIHYPANIPLGIFTLTGFGLAVLLAFLIAQVVTHHLLVERGEDATPVGDLLFAAVVGGLLGAKIYYVILVGDSAAIWSRSGFVFWGGLIGGIIAVVALIRIKRLPIMRLADPAGISIAAAYAVGRTGCWAVGDDYGRPWNGPLAVSFPRGAPASTAGNMHEMFGVPIAPGTSPDTVLSVYPTQLFEIALALGMFGILWRMRHHKHAEGWLFGVYMVLAGIERFIIEFFRAKDDRFFGPLTIAQLLALAFIAAGVVWMQLRSGAARPALSPSRS